MKKKFPIPYRRIQRIKAEEYERFFSRMHGYFLYMNHLGEIRWMSEEEADRQHEFFQYSEPLITRWRRRIHLRRKLDLNKLPDAERELRLHIRLNLEKKYLGEVQPDTARLVPDEWKYDISEEEIDNIPISLDIGNETVWKRLILTVAILALVAIVSYVWVSFGTRPLVGKLLVHGDVPGARVYLDETDFVGYTNKLITNVPAGLHRVTVYKEGYVSIPKYHEVEIQPDSLVTLDFKFKISRREREGFLKIISDEANSKIYVDDGFAGLLSENPVVNLEEGQHTVRVQKTGFVTMPPEKIVHISAGDTSILIFHQAPVPTSGSRAPVSGPGDIGSIEVTSNVKNARIFLNGKDTGQDTDYIFTRLPLGRYLIEVRKDGYGISPPQIALKLTRENPAGSAAFRLTREFERIKISTRPPRGPIFIDGEFKGEGTFEGVVKIGRHHLTFGDLKGYKTPRPRDVDVKAGVPAVVSVSYFPILRMVAEVDDGGNVVTRNCELQTGYTLPDRAFSASSEGGPSIEFNKKIKQYVWKLGYAFPYRNPKGNDAIRVFFKLPRNLDYDQKFTVRMVAASSREKYPLSLSTKVDISVKFNNTILSYRYKPKFLEDVGGLETVEWDVTSAVRPGENVFEVSTTEKNNTFYYVKKIEIFN